MIRFLIGFLPLLASVAFATEDGEMWPPEWLTVAEESGFKATSSHAETLVFLDRVARVSPHIVLTAFGHSAEGRQLPLVIVSKDGHLTAEDARASGRPIGLIQSCIHPGEGDGKTASLMILRDIALGRRNDLLEAGILLFAPIYNADGHERVSPLNRANQNGPEQGMGFRTTTTGLDLNRDHVKLDSVEARALISLVNAWQPHIHVDNHVTNGSEHRWVVTWSRAEAPQLAPSLDDWLNAHMPVVIAEVEEAGFETGPYVSLIDGADPEQGFDSRVTGARYSTGYFTLRNRISILVEMYAYADFETRVRANRRLLEELLLEIARSGTSLVKATTQAEASTVALGRADAPPSTIALQWATSQEADTIRFPVCRWKTSASTVTGKTLAAYDCGPNDPVLEVPWFHRPEVAISVARPRGYLVFAGWPQVEARLADHGLVVRRVSQDTELAVETLRLADPVFASRPYQGRIQVEHVTVTRAAELRRVPAGTLWVPADQPNFELAAQMLEPEGPDSLLRWGLLHSVFERKEYIGTAKLERLSTAMLAEPEVEAAWAQALEDPEFTNNPSARYLWWYSKTAYWDESVGLLPVYRVMSHPNLVTEPWDPPTR